MWRGWPIGEGGGCGAKNKQTNFTNNTYQAVSLTTSKIYGENILGYDTYVQIN